MNRLRWLIALGLLCTLALACNFPTYQSTRPTPTPSATPSPVFTPTPTPTPTQPPTPTPLPAARIQLGDQALLSGDWDAARREFQTALETSPDSEIQYAARLGIGRTHYLARDYEQAEQALDDLIGEAGDSPVLAEAYFFLGQVLDTQERYPEAAEAYAKYLQFRPGVVDGYVQELRGDALQAAGDYAGAIAAYQAALTAPRLNPELGLELKLASAYEMSGDLPTAIVAYQDIYERTSNDFTKAHMDLRLGQAHTALGQTEQAQAAYLDAVMNYPRSYDSYIALSALVEAGVPVDEFQRGLVDYYAGQYGVAIAAFDRYLRADPPDLARALHYTGLSQAGLGEYPGAIETWDRVIQSYPDSEFWDESWEMKAYTLWSQLNQYQEAVQVLLDFVATVPTHPRAAEFLFDAASVAERDRKLDRAASLWERMADEYPESEQAVRALFLAGVTRYRIANHVKAHDDFQRALAMTNDLETRAANFFWLGKTQQALGDSQAARAAWEQAASLDPTDYYSERARDMLLGRAVFTPPQEYDLSFDPLSERLEAEAWIRTIFDLPADTDLSDPGALASDPRFQRGNELWRLGLYPLARAEFEDLRLAVENDPADSYRLANHLIDLGLYRSGILAARRVLTLAGMDDGETMSAPIYFNHLRFGPYFRQLIIPASQTYNFHPLFLFSVARQESLFEGFVRSSADARGLMQIVPATGAELAANASWPPDYAAEDLYRPLVSVNLGASYLNRQRAYLGSDLYAMLAAYNGGPGNAKEWQSLVPPDPDLYLEVIRFEETRNYIRGIYENFNIYRQLYDRTP